MDRSEKLRIVRQITDENFLRTEVLVPILRKMGRFERVIDTHGHDEKGKDIVLVARDALGDLSYTAVILKTAPISYSTQARKRGTVANISNQIFMTLNSGWDCLIQKKHCDFNKIIVITSNRISNTAREELFKSASQHRLTNIVFKETEDVANWIDEYLPDFYYVRSGKLATYFSSVRDQFETLQELTQIAQYRGDCPKLFDVFVPPHLFQMPNKGSELDDHEFRSIRFTSLERILRKNDRILIVGSAGSGKSTLMRAAILQRIAWRPREKSETDLEIPIYVKAAALTQVSETDLIDCINCVVESEHDMQGFDLRNLMEHKILVFVDGLDEVSDHDLLNKLLEQLPKMQFDLPQMQIVVASRRIEELEGNVLEDFQRYYLWPFDTTQIERFVRKWFRATTRGKKETQSRMLEALRDNKLLEKLPKTPLALTLLAILFDSEEYTELPANLSELYEMFIDLVLGRWNLDRRVRTMYDANIRERILTKVALYMHNEKLISISKCQFERIAKNCSDSIGRELDIDRIYREIVEGTSLLRRVGRSELEFRHISFQQFLVGKEFSRRNARTDRELLMRHFADGWWTPVAYYYCGLQKENERFLQALMLEIQGFEKTTRRVIAALYYGYLLQASYFTPAEIRKTVLMNILYQYTRDVDEILREIEVEIEEDDDGGGEPSNSIVFLYLGFLQSFSMFYSSRFLADLYHGAFEKLEKEGRELDDFSWEYCSALMTLACTITDSAEDPEYMARVYDYVQYSPLLALALHYQLKVYEKENPRLKKVAKRAIRRVAKDIEKNIKNNRELYLPYLRDLKP